MMTRSVTTTAALLLLYLHKIIGNNEDRFTYHFDTSPDEQTFGVKDWDQVTCDEFGKCLGWPDGYESRKGWDLTENQCRWCPADPAGPNCTNHRQSPINLERNHGIPNHEKETICKDGHWMAYLPGSCKFSDVIDNDNSILRNNFVIDRHALQIMQPVNEAGELQCERQKFPRIDFAHGYPEWWLLYQTEVKTPSEHAQDGKMYDAEIQLDHVYQVPRKQREIGKVAIFLDGNVNASKWDFLDKLICQWREVEEQTRKDCCLESVPPYAACRNPSRPACGKTATIESNPSEFEPDLDSTKPTSSVVDSERPSVAETGAFRTSSNEKFSCEAYPNVDFARMCKPEGCCETRQKDKTFCKSIYLEFRKDMRLACDQCCDGYNQIAQTTLDYDFDIGVDATKASTLPETTVASTGETETNDERGRVSETFSCRSHSKVDLSRMCKDSGCCQTPRQDGNFCHKVYDEIGNDMALACNKCCDTPKQVGPPMPDHPTYPRIKCSSVDQDVSRICKAGGCCDGSNGSWCQEIYANYTSDRLRSICWYCCSEPRDIGRERQLSVSHDNDGFINKYDYHNKYVATSNDNAEIRQTKLNDLSKETRADELVKNDSHETHRRLVNYDDVQYQPYEWMHKVKTEYYFRYVGTQSVPPCFSRVHWRVIKDPIQVHPDQIAELRRLLAWRIAPFDSLENACEKDTAGRPVNNDYVQVNRPLQAENLLHQVVFCECKDWRSKSLHDQLWCMISNVTKRFYDHPYSALDSNGEF